MPPGAGHCTAVLLEKNSSFTGFLIFPSRTSFQVLRSRRLDPHLPPLASTEIAFLAFMKKSRIPKSLVLSARQYTVCCRLQNLTIDRILELDAIC